MFKNLDMDSFMRDGFLVIPDFLNHTECEELLGRAYEIVGESVKEGKVTIFSTNVEEQLQSPYFLESNDKIRLFYEKNAFDKKGMMTVGPGLAVNKIGHALHFLDPLFRYYTYSVRVRRLLSTLGFIEPAVVQSMVIFKNPRVSSEVQPHQDATYIHTSPKPVLGLWMALEDATLENGCLWFIPQSHTNGVHRRLVRTNIPNSELKVHYTGPQPAYQLSSFIPVPVTRGSCILIHGNVVHKSSINTTDTPRPAYTFHVIEKYDSDISGDNWLLEGPQAPFLNMHYMVQCIGQADSSEVPDSPLPPVAGTENEEQISSTSQL